MLSEGRNNYVLVRFRVRSRVHLMTHLFVWSKLISILSALSLQSKGMLATVPRRSSSPSSDVSFRCLPQQTAASTWPIHILPVPIVNWLQLRVWRLPFLFYYSYKLWGNYWYVDRQMQHCWPHARVKLLLSKLDVLVAITDRLRYQQSLDAYACISSSRSWTVVVFSFSPIFAERSFFPILAWIYILPIWCNGGLTQYCSQIELMRGYSPFLLWMYPLTRYKVELWW